MSTRESQSGPLASILYDGLDHDGVVRDAAFRTTVSVRNVDLLKSDPSGRAVEQIEKLAAIFISSRTSQISERLASARRLDPQLSIYVILESEADGGALIDSLKTSFNSSRVRRWIRRDLSAIERSIGESLQNRETRYNQQKSRRELGNRNRQLRDLQENLERIVSERTSYLVDADRELQARTQATRELVRFIKELSQTESIEEILSLLNHEIRGFHEVRPPLLAAVSSEFGARIHFQQTRGGSARYPTKTVDRNWGSRSVRRLWSARPSIRLNDSEDQAYFAQELGRPVARMMSIPLKRDSRGEQRNHASLLVFEHDLDEPKAERFTRFLIPRIEPLSTALDRIILNRELIATSKLWESTFDGIADPVAVITEQYGVLRMNEAFAVHKGEKCYQLFAGRDLPCEGCQLKQVLESGTPSDWQVRVESTTAAPQVFEANGYPIRLRAWEGEVTLPARSVIHHYINTTHSIELKGQAIQSEKMAAVGLMAGNIAHELNNPLAGLKSLAQVLSHDPRYPDNVRADLREIESASERSSAIIRDLLDFSQADDRIRERVSLNQIIERALNMLKTALHEHRVETDWANDESVTVEVDPHLVQHVIFNIVNNACQAMKESGSIHLRTHRGQNLVGQESVFLEISDTGPGISESLRKRIFEPFFTTKSEGQGTGLGLSMSRWIIENYGGEIALLPSSSSEAKTGAHFRITLPLAQGKNQQGKNQQGKTQQGKNSK